MQYCWPVCNGTFVMVVMESEVSNNKYSRKKCGKKSNKWFLQQAAIFHTTRGCLVGVSNGGWRYY